MAKNSSTREAAFETVIEGYPLNHGHVSVSYDRFDRERAVFPDTVLAVTRETQPAVWGRARLSMEKTGEQVLADLRKWLGTNGSLAKLRYGFKCYSRTLRVVYFEAAQPPIQEQKEIVRQLAKDLTPLQRIVHGTERIVVLLKVRRAALIAAAVTGRIPVEAAA